MCSILKEELNYRVFVYAGDSLYFHGECIFLIIYLLFLTFLFISYGSFFGFYLELFCYCKRLPL